MNIRVLTLLAACLGFSAVAQGQIIQLNSVIGPTGTDALTVAGVGNQVNFTGVSSNSTATTLTAVGSAGSPTFDFNTGFSDTLDRTVGSTTSAGSVIADMKHDSGASGAFVLDTNNDGSFVSEPVQTGFGMHGDTFITFDLVAIRTANSLGASTAFTLTGSAGQANWTPYGQTSAAILLDGVQLAVFDWTETGPAFQFSTYSLAISGSAQYLTFAGLSGLDASNYGAHVGFANVQLQAVPEPATVVLLGLGLTVFGLRRFRRKAA